MSSPHKHAEVIKAWADGVTVQERRMSNGEWQEWKDVVSHAPTFWTDLCYEFRIKPKPDTISYGVFKTQVEMYHNFMMICYTTLPANASINPDYNVVKLTYDGETGKLKSVEIVK